MHRRGFHRARSGRSAPAGLCVLVLKRPDGGPAVTVLNFAREDAEADVDVGGKADGEWADILTGKPVARAADGRLRIRVPALTGTTLVPAGGD